MKALARLRRKFGDREYIRATDAGQLIGFSRPNTYKRHRFDNFVVPTYKIGAAVMVSITEFAKYLDQKTSTTPPRSKTMSPLNNVRRKEALKVLTTLQIAIVELSAIRTTVSAADAENADYTLGMATLTSANLERLLSITDNGKWNQGITATFMQEATGFADSLNQVGLGLAH